MEENSNNSLYPPNIVNEEETRMLLEESKNKFIENIHEINENNVKEIFEGEKKDKEFEEDELLKAEKLGKRKLFWIIILLSIGLFTFHLISIFEINEIIFSIQEELIASIKSYIKKKDREPKDDFYQNFNKINKIFPDYSMFYISSILSDYLNQCFGYITINVLSLCINFLTLFFGFKDFKFNIERKKYINYGLDEFIYLFFLYLVLCIFQGIIVLLPLNIIKKGFKFYESFSKKVQKVCEKTDKEKNSIYKHQYKNNESSININDDNNKNIEENKENNNNIEDNKENNNNLEDKNNNIEKNKENKTIYYDEKEKKLYIDKKFFDKILNAAAEEKRNKNENIFYFKGYFLFFLISLIISVLIKTFLDEKFIGEYNFDTRKDVNYYFIINYCSFTCLSLVFYIIYKYFLFNYKKKKNKINKSSSELFGYVIYSKIIEADDICCCECCEDCKICCQTLNYSLCCYICSCNCCCKTILCCKCNKEKIMKENQYRIRKPKDMNKIETICILYRVTGKCNWLGKILTNTKIYYLVCLLYFALIINMGFEDRFWNNIDNNTGGGKNIYLTNGIVLLYILFLYFLNQIIWKIFEKRLVKKDNEIIDIYSFKGTSIYFTFQPIVSIIISGLVYFRKINKIENYFLSIAIGGSIYIKIYVLEFLSFYFEQNFRSLSLLSSSTIISFYLFIWDIFLFILDIADADNNKIILAQFIILCCFFSLFFLYALIICC